jgi:hypothetical protein
MFKPDEPLLMSGHVAELAKTFSNELSKVFTDGVAHDEG